MMFSFGNYDGLVCYDNYYGFVLFGNYDGLVWFDNYHGLVSFGHIMIFQFDREKKLKDEGVGGLQGVLGQIKPSEFQVILIFVFMMMIILKHYHYDGAWPD